MKKEELKKNGANAVEENNAETFIDYVEDVQPVYSKMDVIPQLLLYLYDDKEIMSEEKKAEFNKLTTSEEQRQYLIAAQESFYKFNAEYAEFMRATIYQDPTALIEFFQNIKKTHFKKCGVRDDGRYNEMQKRLKAAEIALAKNPVAPGEMQLKDAWKILKIRNIFTESELAAFYYYQHPREDTALLDIADHYNLPFGPWLFTLVEAVKHTAENRGFYDLTSTGKKKNDRHKSVELIPLDSGRGFQLNHRKGDIESEITIVNKEFIESPAAMKLFVFLLIKAAQQNFPPIIEFPLKELVAREMYSNTSNARAGVEKQMIAVKSLQIGGKFKKYKRFIDQSSGVLFYHHKIKQNTVYVYCDGEINIEFLASYYTMLPAWSFSLSNNAFLLTLYIFMRARTDRKSNLNISYRAIRDVLALPTKEEYAESGKKFKPDQYVKQPIARAINEIVTAAAANSSDIKITAHDHIPGKQLEDWLNGYIEITVPKEFKKTLAEIKKNQVKRIEANTRKKE